MRSWWIESTGTRTQIEAREVPAPQPGTGQVLVRLRAAGLNRGEFIASQGLHKPGAAKPAGVEGAGEVTALGAGVTQHSIGARVMGRCAGAFAEYALMDAREAIPVPARLTWEEAAAVPLDEWLLVTGISSGVGVAALQTANLLGAKVIGTSGSAEKLNKLKPFGLDLALQTRAGDFSKAALEATGGRGVNVAINTVGGTVFAECVRSLAFEGRLAIVGYVDGVLKAEIDLDTVHAKRLRVFGVSNKLRNAEQRAGSVRAFVADILPAIADGRIRPFVEQVFPFSDLPRAKESMESNRHTGKIVLVMP